MAWRNIWRSPWRSIVVIGSMALGVWAGIFMMGWATGLNDARTVSLLDDNVGQDALRRRPMKPPRRPQHSSRNLQLSWKIYRATRRLRP